MQTRQVHPVILSEPFDYAQGRLRESKDLLIIQGSLDYARDDIVGTPAAGHSLYTVTPRHDDERQHPVNNPSFVIPAQAGGAAHGCTICGPKDGIQSS